MLGSHVLESHHDEVAEVLHLAASDEVLAGRARLARARDWPPKARGGSKNEGTGVSTTGHFNTSDLRHSLRCSGLPRPLSLISGALRRSIETNLGDVFVIAYKLEVD